MSILNKLFGKSEDKNTNNPKSSSRYSELKVSNIKRLTPSAVEVSFDISNQEEAYTFKAGQYINLEAEIGGKNIRRSYSLCSAPYEQKLAVGIKEVEGGAFSTFANQKLAVGDKLPVFYPEGKFILKTNPTAERNFVAFAAGSGITPILAQIKQVIEQEPKSTYTLFYSNKSKDEVMFKPELDELAEKTSRFIVHYFYTQQETENPFYSGRIDEDKCDLIFQQQVNLREADDFYLCGPKPMIDMLQRYLVNSRIPKEKIHFELFTASADEKTVEQKTAAPASAGMSKIFVNCEGESFEFELPYEGDSILDGAIDAGADAPYSCRGGVCSTCQAKLLEGEVEMDMNYTLDQSGIDKGFILTCQSHPKSEKVVIDYDQLT